MKFIFKKQIKYYTKEATKYVNFIAIALFLICTIILLKYNLVCEVSIANENVGYVKNRKVIDNKIKELQKQEGTGNIAFVDIEETPRYSYTLLSKSEELNNEEIISRIEDSAKYTYKYYEVAVNDKTKAVVSSLDEAEQITEEAKKEHGNNIKFTTSIKEIYSENPNAYEVQDITVAKNEVEKELEKIEDASVNGVYLAQKPVSGRITSRYGNRERIRSHSHTGLDIAAPYGTPIKAAADGKVIWSGYKGSYGNLTIIDCGNDVNIYYGHASKLYKKVGDIVKAGDVIAAVGSTGNSTGNHLHFEIRVNGKTVNPQNYIYK